DRIGDEFWLVMVGMFQVDFAQILGELHRGVAGVVFGDLRLETREYPTDQGFAKRGEQVDDNLPRLELARRQRRAEPVGLGAGETTDGLRAETRKNVLNALPNDARFFDPQAVVGANGNSEPGRVRGGQYGFVGHNGPFLKK